MKGYGSLTCDRLRCKFMWAVRTGMTGSPFVIMIHRSKDAADVRRIPLERVGPWDVESFRQQGFGFAAP